MLRYLIKIFNYKHKTNTRELFKNISSKLSTTNVFAGMVT